MTSISVFHPGSWASSHNWSQAIHCSQREPECGGSDGCRLMGKVGSHCNSSEPRGWRISQGKGKAATQQHPVSLVPSAFP